jgi:hypothetical protein
MKTLSNDLKNKLSKFDLTKATGLHFQTKGAC